LVPELILPAGTKAVDAGQGGAIDAGEARFLEERRTASADGVTTVRLRRVSHLPLMRVSPANYQHIAAQLRAVDPIEQSEIRVTLTGE
jgi:hypothetical protein